MFPHSHCSWQQRRWRWSAPDGWGAELGHDLCRTQGRLQAGNHDGVTGILHCQPGHSHGEDETPQMLCTLLPKTRCLCGRLSPGLSRRLRTREAGVPFPGQGGHLWRLLFGLDKLTGLLLTSSLHLRLHTTDLSFFLHSLSGLVHVESDTVQLEGALRAISALPQVCRAYESPGERVKTDILVW